MQELRRSLRSLRKSPSLTATAVVTLAIGTAVNAAVFMLANSLLLRPVPGVSDQGRLVTVQFGDDGGSSIGVSYPNLADLRHETPAFSALAGCCTPANVAVAAKGLPVQQIRGEFVSASYFQVLAGGFLLGRGFTLEDEIGAPTVPVAVVSEHLWRSLGAARSMVGGYLTINGVRTLVLGVGSGGFRGTDRVGAVDLWIPASAYETLRHQRPPVTPVLADRGPKMFQQLVGRLAPGATAAQAQAQLRAAAASLLATYPVANALWKTLPPSVFLGIGLPIKARETVRRAVELLSAVAGLVLLIACANVANLFLFRAVGRREEIAVRRALGATSWKVARAQITECVVVAGLAAGVALALAAWTTALFRGRILPNLGTVDHLPIDWRVLGFAAVLCAAAGVLLGAASALVAIRSDVVAGLKGTAARITPGTGRLRAALASGQLALSLSLLIVAFLLLGTLRNLRHVDVGFDADRVTTFTIGLGEQGGYTRDQSQVLLEEALSRIRALPGVEAVSLSAYSPFTFSMGNRLVPAGAERSDSGLPVTDAYVSPAYFRTMGIPVRGGRTFADAELFGSLTPPDGAAIVTETLAHQLFGEADPVGKMLRSRWPDHAYRIVGVVDDSRWATLADDGTGPLWYRPIPAMGLDATVVLVRSQIPVPALRVAVQQIVSSLVPEVPLFDVQRLHDRIEDTLSQERLLARLLALFAAVAVALASVGLYAVIAVSVGERTRELGLRIALGAPSAKIMRMVLGQGARVGVVGVFGGLAGAVALTRLIASRLYGLSPLEPVQYVGAAAMLFGLALVASAVPARRASRVDPMVALRAE